MDRPQQSKRHRKRHVPAGPAGLWMQQSTTNKDDDQMNDDDDDELMPCRNDAKLTVVSPAWTAAHVQLGISTPSLPCYWSSSRKYDILQRYYTEQSYQLLHDIQTNNDWTLRNCIVVQITSIQSISVNDHLWTLTLTDETDASITAWIQPAFVRHEQQQNAHRILQEGNILVLRDCSLLLVQHEEYIILVGREHVKQWYSALQSDQLPHAEYIRWMERRNNLTMELREQNVIQEEILQEEGNANDDDHSDTTAEPQYAPQKEKQPSSLPVVPTEVRSPDGANTVTLSVQQAPSLRNQNLTLLEQATASSSSRGLPPTKDGTLQRDAAKSNRVAAPHVSPVQPTTSLSPKPKTPLSTKRNKRKRSIFPTGCSNLLTETAWKEMQKYMSDDEQEDLNHPGTDGSPIFSKNFRNLCPSFFDPDAFAGIDMDDYFD